MEAHYAECTTPLEADWPFGGVAGEPPVPTDALFRPSIMRLGAEHERPLAELLLNLDRPSRIHRFGHAASDPCVRAYAKRAVSTAAFMAGVFAGDILVGVIEVFAAGRDIAEVAFAVHTDWRRLGLASALLEIAIQWSKRSGIETLRLVISRSNWPMRQLANKAGARFDLVLDEIYADIRTSKGVQRPENSVNCIGADRDALA